MFKFIDENVVVDGYILFIVLGIYEGVINVCGVLRKELVKDLGYIDDILESLVWIVDFLLFEYSEED